MVEVLNAGHRERQALLKFHDHAFPIKRVNDRPVFPLGYVPFWKYMSLVDYNPITDAFTLPDGTTISVEECNNLETTCSTPE